MNAPPSRIIRNSKVSPRSAMNMMQYHDRNHSTGVSGRTQRGNYAVPAGRSENALPNSDMHAVKRMRNLSSRHRNRVENFSTVGAGGNMDLMSRSHYDIAYVELYNRLAQNAYGSKQGKAPGWSASPF